MQGEYVKSGVVGELRRKSVGMAQIQRNTRRTVGKAWKNGGFMRYAWDVPSGYVKIAIENDHLVRGSSHE